MKTAKQLFFYAFIFTAILASFNFSCNKVKDAIKVNIPFHTAEIEVDIPVIPAADLAVSTGNIDYEVNLDELIQDVNSSLSSENIRSIVAKSCRVTLKNATQENNFSALKSASVEIQSGGNWITLAEINNIEDKYQDMLEFPIKDIDLKNYFGNNSIIYRISGESRKPTTAELKAGVLVKFEIAMTP